jgi:N4-gp56 family major capsid protein
MADFTFATGDALTRKTWAKTWFIETKTESYFYENGFVGKSFDNIIVEFPDLEGKQGDVIYTGLLMELGNAGVTGDNDMETNEEAPNVYDDAITLTQIRNAVRTAGRESEMRPSDNGLREYVKDLLKRWMAAQIDQAIFTALTASPTTVIYGGDATGTGDIAAGDYMELALCSRMKTAFRKANPMVEGPTVKGKKLNGVIIVSSDQEHDLVTYDAAWAQAQREAQKAGDDNPLFAAAIGKYRNMIIHEHPRVSVATTWGATANLAGATALALGVKAGAIGYSKRKIWEEKTFDYSNKTGFCVGSIYGFTKNVFNALDYAVGAIRTYRSNI